MIDDNKASRIPLSLVTGFLGSGKTTFLQHAAARLKGRRVVYLVNEFSALDVDGAALRGLGPQVVSIPGGSIFCRCLVSDFVQHLSEIPRLFATGQAPALDGVIVEASGIANPKVILDMLGETGLDKVYDLACILSVVDPGSFLKLLATLPNIRAQIEAADTILLNKIDLFVPEQVTRTEEAIRRIHPAARVLRTVRAAAEVDLFARPSHADLHGEYADCADPHYGRYSVTLYNAMDLEALRTALQNLGDVLYRAKGFVPVPQDTVYLDWSEAGLSVESRRRGDAEAGLAFIVRADSEEVMESFLRQVQAGAFDARS
jgi:G3E family GTPase